MKRIVLIGLLVIAGAAFAGKSTKNRVDATLAAADKEMVLAAFGVVRWQLTDPESARFRAVAISPGGKAVCGEVNSKNEKGGYDGFHRFYVARDKVVIESIKTPIAAKEWGDRCLSDGEPITN